MSDLLKVGVVGAGVFGAHHARKCVNHPRVEFIGVFDSNLERAKSLAGKHDTQSYAELADLIRDCDALVIASPATSHGVIALLALSAGKHCLIEKPIAARLGDAEKIAAFSRKGLLVQIGHQERFVAQAIGLKDISETPISIVARRQSVRSERNLDVSVTLDLMTHDLDLAGYLTGYIGRLVKAQTESLFSGGIDAAQAELLFGQTRVTLAASRDAAENLRVMKLLYPSGEIVIDFGQKTLTNQTAFQLNESFAQSPIVKDSLGAATDSFISAILDGTPVSVSAQEGLSALRLAKKIDGDA